MKILSPFDVTKLNSTSVGDLVRLAHSQAPLGLVVHEEEGKKVVAVLQDMGGRPPYHIVFERDFDCYRYAAGWVLDLPREHASFGPAGSLSNAPGVIHIGPTGVVLNLAPLDAMQNELTVNLGTFDWDDVAPKSVAFPRWRIWASEADMTKAGASPILDFEVTA